MKSATLIVFALLCAAQLYSVPVNGELIIVEAAFPGTFTINGPNFFLTASFDWFGNIGGRICAQGCEPGSTLFPDFSFDWDKLRLNSVTVDGVAYQGFFGDASTPFTSFFDLDAPDIPITNSLVYAAPVTIDGFLVVYDKDDFTCILCQPDQNQSPLLITGSGQVTVTLRELPEVPGGSPLILDRAVYQFVPEPSTFLLLGVPLAICFVRRLFR